MQTETIYFKTALSNIEKQEEEKLLKIANSQQFYLIGHTDNEGNQAYNLNLSKQRVHEVYDFLVSKGIEKDRISIEFYGENKPLNNNKSSKDKSKNRRVEIKYIKDPLMDFTVTKQIFKVNNDKETMIKGKEGTKIIIPVNTFKEKNVQIELKEFYNTLDILSANLSTKSGDKLLESSGMIHIKAYANNQEVLPQNDITIKFKKMSNQEDFFIFEGKVDKESLETNWSIEGYKDDLIAEEIVDGNNRLMSDFTVKSQFGLLLNKGKYSWFSTNKESKYYEQSVDWESWAQFFDYTDFYNTKDHQCFEDSYIEVLLDSKGKVKNYKAEFDKEDAYCNIFFKEILTNNIIGKGLKGESLLSIKFDMDFSELDSISIFNEKENKRLQAEWDAKRDSINNFFAAQRTKELTKYKANYETNLIVTKSAKLGWINCDRFVKNQAKTDFLVKVSPEMNVRMVVKRFHSFYNSRTDYNSSTSHVFSRLPIGEAVTIICTSYKDGKILLAIEDTKISTKIFSDFHFEVLTKEELRKKIEQI